MLGINQLQTTETLNTAHLVLHADSTTMFFSCWSSVCSSTWLLIRGILNSLSTLHNTLCSFSLLLLTHFYFFFFFWGGVLFFFYSVFASSVAGGSSATASVPRATYWIVSTLLSELQWISCLSKNPCAMRTIQLLLWILLAESGKGEVRSLLFST